MNTNVLKELIPTTKQDVDGLFKALGNGMEWVRVDIHVFNAGSYLSFAYGNDPDELLEMGGTAENAVIDIADFFELFEKYGSKEMREYYEELVDNV